MNLKLFDLLFHLRCSCQKCGNDNDSGKIGCDTVAKFKSG